MITATRAGADIEAAIAASRTAAMLAAERRRDEQRAARLEQDRKDTQEAGWLPPDPPPRNPKALDLPPRTTSTSRKTAKSKPPAQPTVSTARPAKKVTPPAAGKPKPPDVPPGYLLLSPSEVAVMRELVDTHPVTRHRAIGALTARF